MVALGLVLLVLAVLATVGTVFFNGNPVAAEVFGVSLKHVSVGGFFLVGVVTGIVGMLGLSLMLGGGARKRRKRLATKREARDVRGQRESLAEENARLQSELSARSERTDGAPAYPGEAGSRREGRTP